MSDHSHGPAAAYRRWGYAAEREQQRRERSHRDLFPEVAAPPELNDGDQRFTLPETDAWARAKAGIDAWDLDVAACDEAHLAEKYFTRTTNGLMQSWAGRCWCNPPFSDIEPWVLKAWQETSRCPVIAMLVPASRTEQGWWQDLIEPWRDRERAFTSHFLPGRTRFGHPGNVRGLGVGSPPFGCVLLLWRSP